ncbi:MAG: hypothetical protein ACM338_00590, partial [Betaproteobacteria bacterium]
MRNRSLLIAIAVGTCLSGTVTGAVGGYMSAELLLGDHTFPKLQIWNFQDRTHAPRLFVSNTAGSDGMDSPSFFYSLVPPGISGPHAAFSSAIRSEGSADVAGGILYGETSGTSNAFGANPIAASYSGAPAVGMEVNGLNFSANPNASVRGIDIVNGGTAETQWGLGIETS